MNILLRSAFVLALAAAALAAHALTVSGGSLTYTGVTDYNRQLGNLAKFDPALGTLTGVTFTAGYGFSSTILLRTSPQEQSGDVSMRSAANFGTTDLAVKSVLDALINVRPNATFPPGSVLAPVAFDLTGGSRHFTLAVATSQTYISNAAYSSATYDVDPSNLAPFLATPGSTLFDVSGRTLSGVILANVTGNPANIIRSDTTQATQGIGVVYTYQPVPEPSALAALGLGAAAMLRRRKRA